MKKRLKLLLLLLILSAISTSGLMAQSLVVRLYNGAESSAQVGSIQKLSFADGNLLISYKTDSTGSFPLADIQKIYFGSETSVPQAEVADPNKLSVYPNPVSQELTLLNIPANISRIFIYSIDGKLVMIVPVSTESETINVSNLESGIYLLIANGQSVRFIKL